MGTQPQTTEAESNYGALADSGQPFQDAPQELFNIPTTLSEYFFREVIALYCSWDSKSNVMRTIVENMWQSFEALYHAIQTMAAACLPNDFPRLLNRVYGRIGYKWTTSDIAICCASEINGMYLWLPNA